jgi:hypothetical protein
MIDVYKFDKPEGIKQSTHSIFGAESFTLQTTPSTTETAPITTTTKVEEVTNDLSNNSMESKPHDSECADKADGEFIRDAFNCSVFYTCYMGKVRNRTSCDKGLYFDIDIGVCNWKSVVKC